MVCHGFSNRFFRSSAGKNTYSTGMFSDLMARKSAEVATRLGENYVYNVTSNSAMYVMKEPASVTAS